MNSSATGHRRPGAFSSRPPSSPNIYQGQPTEPSESDDSSSRSVSREQSSPRPQQHARPSIYPDSGAASSTNSFSNFSRPGFSRQGSNEPPSRLSGGELKGHRRQHSQGFFEPSLPSASVSDQNVMSNLSASQIAAQAAMQHGSHSRQRSQTIPSPQNSPPGTIVGRRKPPPIQTAGPEGRRTQGPPTPGARQFYNSTVGGNASTAATAATAAYPGKLSPGLSGFDAPPPPPPEKEHRLRPEKSKLKLFSKPKDKTNKEVERPLPSPNRFDTAPPPGLGKLANQSTASLADSLASGASSLYSLNTGNASTSTLVPTKRGDDKEKPHKHHFLSRQKNKLKDRIGDDHSLQLSSASSNSRPTDPHAPSTLYSFGPSPASPATTSFTGLDLRHAGRAVREKKKEEKILPFAPKITDIDKIDFAGTGRATPAASMYGSAISDLPTAGTGYGLHNLRPEDVWGFLRAKLLNIFEGDELRIPVEDLNVLVTIHLQRCIHQRNPTAITEDLRSLLNAGFNSLNHTLRSSNDQRLVPHLVATWLFLFGTVLPFIQAVFLPLDLEFKGHGPLMTSQEAVEFWGANPDSSSSEPFGNEFDVRRIVLLCYRDAIILPRYESLKDKFSRLSLDSIATAASPIVDSFDTLTSSSSSARPGTAGSHDPTLSASYNSQSSTLYDPSNPSRSRGNSNLSAPELPSFAPTAAPTSQPSGVRPQTQRLPDSNQVTETVGRMLQCVSVLASAQSGDESQKKMEDLAKALKLNWLGRGRVGRNRRGIVGGKGGGGGLGAGFAGARAVAAGAG